MKPAAPDDPGPLPELAWLPVAKCHVDRRYQRSLESARSQAHVIAIAENFRWAAFQAVLATEDGAGGWLIIDGQHRCAAAKRRGIAHVPAVVVKAVGLEEQAAAFIDANRRRVPVNQFIVFHSQVAAGDAVAKQVATICASADIVIPRYAANPQRLPPGATFAVATLLALVRQRGAADAALAIGAVAAAYRAIPGALRAPFFDGAARYLAFWPKAERQRASDKATKYFAATTPDRVFAAMSARGNAGHASRGRAIAALIAKQFPLPKTAPPAPRIAPVRVRPGASRTDEDKAVAAFIARKGVTRAVDFGAHQAIVDAARFAHDCVIVRRVGAVIHWRLDGAVIETPELYRRVNQDIEKRGLAPIDMPAGTAGRRARIVTGTRKLVGTPPAKAAPA